MKTILRGSGTPHTEESKAKISAANKGKQSWNVGLKHSPETKQRIAEKTRLAMLKRKEDKAAELGMTLQQYEDLKQKKKMEVRELKKKQKVGISEEGRRNISESTKKRWNVEGYREMYTLKMTGNRSHTAETRARISAKIKLKWQTDETYRSKVLISPTDEIKAKISATLKAKWADPEYRQKMSNIASSRSLEWRQSIADSIREKWKDPEYRNAVLGAARNCTIVVRGGSRAKTIVLDPEEAMRRKVERNKIRREKERARRQLISAAKKESRDKAGNRTIKEILGRELWFEEKLRRKKTGGVFLDDEELEKQLTDEWQEKEEEVFDEDFLLLGKQAKRGKLLEEDDDEHDDEDDIDYDEAEDELTPEDMYDRPHRDSIDDDIIEVYDQDGELVGTYTASEFEKMRAGKL